MSNFTMGTILEKDFAQAQVPKAKPFPMIVPMAKLHTLIVTLMIRKCVKKIGQIASFMSTMGK